MKLIDVLVMISNGELKDGTKIKIGREIYSWNTGIMKNAFEGEDDTYLDPMRCLDSEVEIIGKETNVATKIEELNYTVEGLEKPSYNESWLMNCVRENRDKLNEVIRELNKTKCEHNFIPTYCDWTGSYIECKCTKCGEEKICRSGE